VGVACGFDEFFVHISKIGQGVMALSVKKLYLFENDVFRPAPFFQVTVQYGYFQLFYPVLVWIFVQA
jgi:hypothetical protein